MNTTDKIIPVQKPKSKNKKLNQKFNLRESGFLSFLQNVLEGVQVVDFEHRYLFVNDAAVKQNRIPREELIGYTQMEKYPGFEKTEIFAKISTCLKERVSQYMVNEFTFQDKSSGWYEVRVEPVLEGALILSLDITEQKRAETEHKKGQLILKAILEATPNPIYLKDKDSRIILANPATLEALGKSPDEVIGKSDIEFIDNTETAKALMENDRTVMKSGITFVVEEYLNTPQGEKVFLSSKTPYRDDKGNITGVFGISQDITEIKRTEKAMQESELKYRKLFENITYGFQLNEVITDDKNEPTDFRFLEVNKYYKDFAGLNPEEIKGKTIKEVLPDADINMIKKYGQVALTGIPFDMEYYSKTFKKYIRAHAYCPLKGQFATIFEDITERKEIEQALKDSQETLVNITENIPVYISLANKNLEYIFVNKEYEYFFKMKKEEIIGKKVKDIIGNTAFEKAYPNMLKTLEGNTVTFENKIINKEGIEQIIQTTFTPYYQNNIINGIITMVIDITERKRAEEEREQFYKFFKTSSDVMVIVDSYGIFLKVNPSTLKILGYSEDELISRPFKDFIHPDDRQFTLSEIARQTKSRSLVEIENRYICKDGTIRWLSWSSNYNRDEGMTFATARDITLIKQAEENIRIAMEKEREAIHLKSNFISTVSHQFKTPLTVIQSNFELINMYKDMINDSYRDKFGVISERIVKEIRKLNLLLDDVLKLSFIAPENVRITLQKTDIIKTIKEVVSAVNIIQDDGRIVDLEINFKQKRICSEPEIISNVLLNILSNAFKYSKGRKNPTLKCSLSEDRVIIEIKDYGIGIPEEDLQNISTAFFRAKNTKYMEGTGLGLKISKEYLELINGSFSIESVENTYTLVKITLPVKCA